MQEIKRLKTAYSVFSICLLLFGTFILIYPNASIHIVYKVGGVIFIGFGITKMIGYFSKDIFQLAFQHDLAMGIVSILIGLIMLFQTENMIRILAIIISLFMIIDALLKIQTAIDAKKIGIEKWWLILVIGISVAVIGVILFFEPFHGTQVIVRFIGFILFIDGILNLCVVQNTVSTMKKDIRQDFMMNKKRFEKFYFKYKKENELWELQMN